MALSTNSLLIKWFENVKIKVYQALYQCSRVINYKCFDHYLQQSKRRRTKQIVNKLDNCKKALKLLSKFEVHLNHVINLIHLVTLQLDR